MAEWMVKAFKSECVFTWQILVLHFVSYLLFASCSSLLLIHLFNKIIISDTLKLLVVTLSKLKFQMLLQNEVACLFERLSSIEKVEFS